MLEADFVKVELVGQASQIHSGSIIRQHCMPVATGWVPEMHHRHRTCRAKPQNPSALAACRPFQGSHEALSSPCQMHVVKMKTQQLGAALMQPGLHQKTVPNRARTKARLTMASACKESCSVQDITRADRNRTSECHGQKMHMCLHSSRQMSCLRMQAQK